MTSGPLLRFAAACALAAGFAACSSGASDDTNPPTTPPTTVDLDAVVATSEAPSAPLTVPARDESPARGGVVRVGMWAEPDPAASHPGGQIVRSLVQPQLFTPRPDGGWAPNLVEPGSVVEADDLSSVRFALRAGASWSDGRPIGATDLSHTADPRFVASVADVGDGVIEVTFTQPLPGWRRLWSGDAAVLPQVEGVYGGPFRVVEVTPGLETVLVPNDAWFGRELDEFGGGPFVDELRLVVVPDQTTLMQLFEAGELDVVAPWAAPGRVLWMEEAATGGVGVAAGDGWAMVAQVHPERVADPDRRSLLTGLDPTDLVSALLKGEAVAGPEAGIGARAPAELGAAVQITMADDVPSPGFAARALQLAISDLDGVVPELRQAPTPLVSGWFAGRDFDVHIGPHYLGPSPCHVCIYGAVAPGEAQLADAGEVGALELALADRALARTLWVPVRAVGWHEGIEGIEPNGHALFATWNAWAWWVQ